MGITSSLAPASRNSNNLTNSSQALKLRRDVPAAVQCPHDFDAVICMTIDNQVAAVGEERTLQRSIKRLFQLLWFPINYQDYSRSVALQSLDACVDERYYLFIQGSIIDSYQPVHSIQVHLISLKPL